MSERRPSAWIPPLALISLTCLVSCLSPIAAPDHAVGTPAKRIQTGTATSKPTSSASPVSTASPVETSVPTATPPTPTATPTADATPTATPAASSTVDRNRITISTWVGNGTSGNVDANGQSARFGTLGQCAFDSHGKLYVCDQDNFAIREVTASGDVTTLTLAASSTATLGSPSCIAVDQQDNLYVDSHGIAKITPQGFASQLVKSTNFSGTPQDGPIASATVGVVQGMAVASNGDLFFTDNDGAVRKISNGQVTTIAGTGTGSAALIGQPGAIAFDKDGNLLIADSSKIDRVTPAGTVTTLADDTGKPLTYVGLRTLCTDAVGNLYAAYADGLDEISASGHVTVLSSPNLATDIDGTPAAFPLAIGLAIDSQGMLYMPDGFKYCIYKITLPAS